ncbi:Uncharacterised protein [Vibrio cholerae]|uniref:Uncharacterized protein n=1 Tax=Vibrio cholerae TaxID=666 RepID=A0A655Q7Z6_VIBCL|nr:Uncharacterised protein [Vibrio cholerae]CSA31693.1 Uncharacterised protein [Vibrio cholerae]CSA47422.1 Uncharacterised protein [Vibrio cholerae]CSA48098.1 Uncharacterised protein [Vibrio cholerae]CSB76743.1 Uncharacterised protein [Vibrio cholerae]
MARFTGHANGIRHMAFVRADRHQAGGFTDDAVIRFKWGVFGKVACTEHGSFFIAGRQHIQRLGLFAPIDVFHRFINKGEETFHIRGP